MVTSLADLRSLGFVLSLSTGNYTGTAESINRGRQVYNNGRELHFMYRTDSR